VFPLANFDGLDKFRKVCRNCLFTYAFQPVAKLGRFRDCLVCQIN